MALLLLQYILHVDARQQKYLNSFNLLVPFDLKKSYAPVTFDMT